ncbi:MAG: Smr/MutS family protein [Deltaproteobacteria bacterium]|jgi:DNA-nicking Smr family endonuclease|nr:Smr/MutS family protein [Deltaproteobacteria bacterium]
MARGGGRGKGGTGRGRGGPPGGGIRDDKFFEAGPDGDTGSAGERGDGFPSPFAALAGLRDSLLEGQNQARMSRAKQEARSRKELKAVKADLLSRGGDASCQAVVEAAATGGEIERLRAESERRREETDQNLFLRAMEGVEPLPETGRRREQEPLSAATWKGPTQDDEDMSVMRDLADLVTGKAEFDFSFTDELSEAHVRGLPPAMMDQLRKGLVPVQDHLDLHGMNLEQAEKAIGDFVTRSVYLGRTCVLLIHGRGQGSPDGIPVIKRNLESLLLRRPIKKHILAFTTARAVDGGSGASYILLRG